MKNLLLFLLFIFSLSTNFTQSSDNSNKPHFLIPPIYQNVKDFSEGLAPVKKDGKWGFVDNYGTVVIDIKIKKQHPFQKD